MNTLSIEKQNKIIDFGKTQIFSLDEICQNVDVSHNTARSLFNKHNIVVFDTYTIKHKRKIEAIRHYYEEQHNIALLFNVFSRNYDDIVKVLSEIILKIDDDIVIQFFASKNGTCAKARYFAIQKRYMQKIATNIECQIFDYVNCRFADSKSFIETYIRIKNKIEVRPVCEECGNEVKFVNSKKHGLFHRFCCKKCSNSNELTKQRVREYNLKTYGVPVTSQAQCVKDKAKKHFQETYGVDNPWQAEEVKLKSKCTKQNRYGDENYNNREKSEKTCLDKYGVRVSSQNSDVQRKASYSYHMVIFERYGTEWPMQNDEVKAKQKSSMMTNYGSTSYFSSNSYKEKCIELFGVENPMQCSEIRNKTISKYHFKDVLFDSAPEIAFYIWLKDNNISFEYQPNVSFEYMFNNEIHKYFPDFKIGNELYEIKGDHFFKDGKMICPYRDKKWTDEKYVSMCELYEAKHQCMLKNGVKILVSKDYKKYVDYVKHAYGNKYLTQFKCKSQKTQKNISSDVVNSNFIS